MTRGLVGQKTLARMATHELLISAVLLILVTVLINQSLCVHGKDCEGKFIVVNYGCMQDQVP